MVKKGDKFKFTCLGVAEATPDFILYRVKEDNGYSTKYIEKYNRYHLEKNKEYEATVTGLSIFKNALALELTVNSIDDEIEKKDRLMYKSIISTWSLIKR